MQIDGISHATILTIISEVGPEGFSAFPTSKHFTSWMRLAPNNKKTGGKIISNKVPKGSNRLKIALRQAANSIGNSKDTHLSNFFKNTLSKRKNCCSKCHCKKVSCDYMEHDCKETTLRSSHSIFIS